MNFRFNRSRRATIHERPAAYDREVVVVRLQVQCRDDQAAHRMRRHSPHAAQGKIIYFLILLHVPLADTIENQSSLNISQEASC